MRPKRVPRLLFFSLLPGETVILAIERLARSPGFLFGRRRMVIAIAPLAHIQEGASINIGLLIEAVFITRRVRRDSWRVRSFAPIVFFGSASRAIC
jgi:hypothetical protein